MNSMQHKKKSIVTFKNITGIIQQTANVYSFEVINEEFPASIAIINDCLQQK